MRRFKLSFALLLIASLFITSCQKEATDQNFDQQVVEQSEIISDTPEDFTKEKVAPPLGEKQLETSGIQSYIDRPKSEALSPNEAIATSRNSNWTSCGKTIYSTTYDAGNHYNGKHYLKGCLDKYYAFDAPDKEYLFYVPQTMNVSIKLSQLKKDLDLFLFTANRSNTPQHCIGSSTNSDQNSETLTLKLNKGVYIIVIDGFKKSQVSAFKLKVNCEDGCDDFDNYDLGNISSQSADWSKWVPGATFDGEVTNARYYSAKRSLRIDHKPGHSANNQPDVIKKIGEYTSGRYFIKWKMYVPHNRNAAFNFQKYNIPGLETGLVVYLRKGKGITIRANNQLYQSTKTYSQGTWIDIIVDYDISGGVAVLHVDDKMIAIWDTNIRYNTPVHGVNRLGGIDFWAYHEATTYYVDDFCIDDLSGIIIDYVYDPAAIYLDVL